MKPNEVVKTKNTAVRTVNKITADASGKMPQRLQLVPSGTWPGSYKGDLVITADDLNEMKQNFDKGVGLPDGGSEGAPVDYSHEDWSQAAFWIKAVDVIDNILWATDIEWTPTGEEAIKSKRFKFFSPSFYPGCLGSWRDPENPTNTAQNVLVGGGLTNIPFFKGLTGIKASTSASAGSDESTIYIKANAKGENMDFAAARAMKPAELTDEAKQVLADNKDKLTAAEIVAFGLEDKPAEPAKPTNASQVDAETEEARKLQASVKSGENVVVKASELADMRKRLEETEKVSGDYKKEKVEASVRKHVERGAIKADQADDWRDKILADASLEQTLAALPDNKLLASEIGKAEGEAKTALQEVNERVTAKIEASVANGHAQLSRNQAIAEVMKEDKELQGRYHAEISAKQA